MLEGVRHYRQDSVVDLHLQEKGHSFKDANVHIMESVRVGVAEN